MSRKPMTESERLVGRRKPKDAEPIDRLMARFLTHGGRPIEQIRPSSDDMKAAHRKARRNGWIEAGTPAHSPSGTRRDVYWRLTEAGHQEALGARDRVMAAELEKQAWAREFLARHHEAHPRLEDTGPKPSEKNFAPTM